MSNERIVIEVYGDEADAQIAWRLIREMFRSKDIHADAVLFDGPLYAKTDNDFIEVRDNNE
ncbi:hypothetical protein LCGC14_2547950 [marine sediment metagenome]|uniref:Uncharacterized protein n=1 Tax=marine sediment metagenome TaxID=412755 RepID=A0A0F9DGX1_9ZZZZ